MCDINGEILFCTCETLKENPSKQLYWKLLRVNDKKLDSWMDAIIGKTLLPSKNIEEINDKALKKKLNNTDCFDFEYQPKENDFLIITAQLVTTDNYTHPKPYLCFSYLENNWEIKHFSDMNIEIEEIKAGKIKLT